MLLLCGGRNGGRSGRRLGAGRRSFLRSQDDAPSNQRRRRFLFGTTAVGDRGRLLALVAWTRATCNEGSSNTEILELLVSERKSLVQLQRRTVFEKFRVAARKQEKGNAWQHRLTRDVRGGRRREGRARPGAVQGAVLKNSL